MVDPDLNYTMKEDTSLEIDLLGRFTDIDGDKLTYSAGTIDNIIVNMEGTELTLIPDKDWSGSTMIPIYCNDGTIGIMGSIKLNVENTNDWPYGLKIEFESKYVEGSPQIVNASAFDPDLEYGDSLNFTWRTNGEVFGYGEKIDLGLPPGHYLINLTVTDGSGGMVSEEFTVAITGLPDATDPPLMIIALAAVMVVIVIVLVYFFVVKGKEKQTTNKNWPEPTPVIDGQTVTAPVDPETVEGYNED
jgi:hypothetical protein